MNLLHDSVYSYVPEYDNITHTHSLYPYNTVMEFITGAGHVHLSLAGTIPQNCRCSTTCQEWHLFYCLPNCHL